MLSAGGLGGGGALWRVGWDGVGREGRLQAGDDAGCRGPEAVDWDCLEAAVAEAEACCGPFDDYSLRCVVATGHQ